MSHAFQISDEIYEKVAELAAARGKTPDALFQLWIQQNLARDLGPGPYETDDWFRHLGESEEMIRLSRQIAEEELAQERAQRDA
jgi:hypothetical protein